MIVKRIIKKIMYYKTKYYYIGFIKRLILNVTPRYKPMSLLFLGKKIKIVDACTFLSSVKEIFIQKIYEFNTTSKKPYIIDCGSNIGLSVIFFKLLYPDSKIIAFEPDPNIFDILTYNINSFGLHNVELKNKAVWISEKDIDFWLEGGHSGRIIKDGDNKNIIKIKTERLQNILIENIDFLKIDIEGAEYDVLKDCADKLVYVKNLFIEYHSHIAEKQILDKLLRIITEAGFRYSITEAFACKNPFTEKKVMLGMDLQLNIFAFKKII